MIEKPRMEETKRQRVRERERDNINESGPAPKTCSHKQRQKSCKSKSICDWCVKQMNNVKDTP